MTLTDHQMERYSRQIILEQVGGTGQERLLESKVLIIGAGGLGAPAALYLAAAGVGTIGIVDADPVDLTNLQRQVIHHTPDIGSDKVESAAAKMRAINPDVTVRTYNHFVRAQNIRPLLREYDFVIDGTDSFAAKFLINDACWFEGKPLSHAGILGFDGQLMTIVPGQSACYRCVFQGPPPANAVPSCSRAGVLGVVAGVIGCLQATEAIKSVLGIGELLTDSLLTYNALTLAFRKIPIRRHPRCPLCGDSPTIRDLVDEESTCPDVLVRLDPQQSHGR
jgi:molybdopterin/thiamine biosynthesis adenylyltransferase